MESCGISLRYFSKYQHGTVPMYSKKLDLALLITTIHVFCAAKCNAVV